MFQGVNASDREKDLGMRRMLSDMKLLVTLPALNEEATIFDVIKRVPRRIEGVSEIRVLVIDDGSTDRTANRAESAGATVVKHWSNRGVGAAFQTGVQWAILNGIDIYCSIDSDGQFDPGDIPELVSPIVQGRADFSTASRFMKRELSQKCR